jgi:serine/threonine-protein kinase
VARAADGSLQQVTVLELEPETRCWAEYEQLDLSGYEDERLATYLGHGRLDDLVETIYLRSSYVPGRSFPEWVAAARPAPARAVEVVRGICGAAQTAVETLRGAMPIEPAMVRIAPDGRGWLSGVAEHWFRRELEREQYFEDHGDPSLLALAYVSPEEATEAREVRAAPCGVYRLGGLLYLALTGRPPFIPTSARVLLEILDTPPPAPSSLRPEVSPELDAVVLRALEKEPEARYPDPLALEAALAETPEGRADG